MKLWKINKLEIFSEHYFRQRNENKESPTLDACRDACRLDHGPASVVRERHESEFRKGQVMQRKENLTLKTDPEYLSDLIARLRLIPNYHGIDGYDIDRLGWIKSKLSAPAPVLNSLDDAIKKNLNSLDDADHLRDLAERLRLIPNYPGIDGCDIKRLEWVASKLTSEKGTAGYEVKIVVAFPLIGSEGCLEDRIKEKIASGWRVQQILEMQTGPRFAALMIREPR
jgi:hypothetical protein